MNQLNFDSGVVVFKVNGGADLAFNPTDADLMARLVESAKTLNGLQDRYHNAARDRSDLTGFDVNKAAESPDTLAALSDAADKYLAEIGEISKTMHNTIDTAFDQPGVSRAVFAGQPPYAFTTDGVPIWYAFLLAVIDKFPEAAQARSALTEQTIRKYTDKYTRKYHH